MIPLLLVMMLPGGTSSVALRAPGSVQPQPPPPPPSKLRVNGLFSDFMVLQTNYEGGLRPFLHGSAGPGEVVTLTGAPSRTKGKASFAAAADNTTGRWVMQLDPHIQANHQSFTLVLSGSFNPAATIVARNVVYGDVFLCSGQVRRPAKRTCRTGVVVSRLTRAPCRAVTSLCLCAAVCIA